MDFTRKDEFVANGLRTNVPTSWIYFSVVMRNSVRIAFLLATLNDLNVIVCDISNVYLNAASKEKICLLVVRNVE